MDAPRYCFCLCHTDEDRRQIYVPCDDSDLAAIEAVCACTDCINCHVGVLMTGKSSPRRRLRRRGPA